MGRRAHGVSPSGEVGLEHVTLTEFPYCPCIKNPSPYGLTPLPSPASNTHCFRVNVNEPENCDTYCCTQADLMKLEMDVKPECKVSGQTLSATVNGKPAATAPTIEKSVDKGTNTYIFKLTNLGLNRSNANQTEICITLGDNKPGACTTLEQLCVPPKGSAPSECNTALFDSKVKCCAMPERGDITPGLVNPPTPQAQPTPCKSCAYLVLRARSAIGSQPPFSFSQDVCAEFAAAIAADLEVSVIKAGALISTPFTLTECTALQAKVCGEFPSEDEGAKLQPLAPEMLWRWLSFINPSVLQSYIPTAAIAGDGSDGTMPPEGCLNEIATVLCAPPVQGFPKCECARAADSMPFTTSGLVAAMPGRNENATMYCIDIVALANPSRGPAACRQAGVLNKVEFLAQDALRRKLTGVFVQAAGAAAMRFVEPSWGPYGENILKVTRLNWNSTQADGAKVCLEVSNTVTLQQFCMAGCDGRCLFSLFDASRSCCPVYAAALA